MKQEKQMMSNNDTCEDEQENTVLVLKGSYQEFERLQSMFQSGELEKLLGITVSTLQATSQHKNLDSGSSKEKSNSRISSPLTTQIESIAVNLREWLQNQFAPEWQLAQVVAPTAYRTVSDEISPTAIIRAKQINLGDALQLTLVINLSSPNEDDEVEIIIKVYPHDLTKYLPPGLKFTVFDELDCVFEELQANEADSWLGVRFNVIEGQFSINLSLEETIFEERFDI